MELIIAFLILILAIVVLSAFSSGTEAALLSISYAKVKELSSSKIQKIRRKGKLLLHIKDNLQKYITSIVIFNNSVNIFGSIFVGVIATRLFGEVYLGVVSAALTFLIILFSEIIPKVYGEKYCDTISLLVTRPLIIVTFILTPLIFILQFLARFFIKGDKTSYVSEGEIREMAVMGKQEGSINSYESSVIEKVFKMNDTQAYDIMVPKNKVITIEYDAKIEDVIKIIEETGFTRFPVEKNGELLGLINAKDLFKYHKKDKEFHTSKILRPIIYAPEMMKIYTLEQRLKRNRVHMAIIVNEHGDFTGIVTLEDIIEELLGEIEDEFDLEEKLVRKVNDKKFVIKGSIEIDDLNEELRLNLNEEADYNTLNGYLIYKLGTIPKVNDKVKINRGTFRVIKRNKKKVLEVEYVRKEKSLS